MSARSFAAAALLLLSVSLSAAEAPGLAVGTAAPAMNGKTWVTEDGKTPDLQGKVYLVEFWFER